MGEAYRGLTIRIGANTTLLESALKNINRSLTSTQTLLNIVNKGLRFDPSSTKLLSSQVDLTREKITETNTKLELMRRKYGELASDGSIAKLAAMQENFGLRVQRTRDELAKVTNTLETNHNGLMQVNEALKLGWSNNRIKENVEGFRQAVMQATDATESQKARVNELADSCRELAPEFMRLDTEMKKLGDAQEMRKLDVQIRATEAELDSLVNELVELELRERAAGSESAEFRKIKAESQIAEVAAKQLKDELDKINAALKLDPGNVQLLAARERTVKDYTEATNAALKEQEATLKELKGKGVENVSKSMLQVKQETAAATEKLKEMHKTSAQLESEISAARSQLTLYAERIRAGEQLTREEYADRQRLRKQLSDNVNEQKRITSELEKQVVLVERVTDEGRWLTVTRSQEAAKVSANSFNSTLGTTTARLARIRDLATTLGATISPVIMTLGYKVISAADDIDSAFRDMKKTVDGTEEQFESLRESALKFSQTHPVSADTILEIEAMGGQLGIAVENLEAFAETVSNLDIATNMDAQDIAQNLGQLSNILKFDVDDMDNFADALVRLGNNLPAQESAIMDIATRLAPMASLIDMNTQEVLAWSAAAASTGQGAETLGTNIAKAMGQIEATVGGYRDGLKGAAEDMANFVKVTGWSAEQFADTWERDPTAALHRFLEGLKDIDDDGGSVDAMLQRMEITSIREKTALEGLTTTLDILDESLDMSASAWGDEEKGIAAGGDAAREAAQKAEGFSGALQILKDNAQVLGAEIGNTLTPFLNILSDVLGTLAEAFRDMPDFMKYTIVAFGGLAAVVGPVGRIISQFGITASGTGATIGDAANHIETFGTKLKKLDARFATNTTGMGKAERATARYRTAVDMSETKVLQLMERQDELKGKLTASNTATATASTKMKLFGTQMQITALQSQALGTALSAAKGLMLGIVSVAVLTGLTKLAERVKENHQRAREYRESSKALYDISRKQLKVTESIAAANASYAPSYAKVREEVDKLYEAQRNLAESLEDIYSDATANMTELEMYAGIVKQLADGTERSASETETLKNTVDKLNELMGTSLSVGGEYNTNLVDENGNILANVDALDEYIKKQEEKIRLQAYEDQLSTAIKDKVDAEMAYADAIELTNAKYKEYMDYIASHPTDEAGIRMYEKAWKDAAKAEDDAKQVAINSESAYKNLYDKYMGVADGADEFANSLDGAKDSMYDAADAATRSAGTIESEFTGLVAKSPGWGYDLVKGISGGMTSPAATALVSGAARTVADIINRPLHFSLPDTGPLRQVPSWPIHMAQEWAKGAERALPIYSDAARNIAGTIADGLDVSHILEARDQAINMSMDAPTLGSTYVIYQTTLNGAVLNDDIQIQSVSRNFLTELMRKVDA